MSKGRHGSIVLYTPGKILRELKGQPGEREMERLLETKRVHLTKLYMLPEGVVGAIMVASEVAGNHKKIVVPYLLNRRRLILVAEGEDARPLETLIEKVEYEQEDTSELLFCKFLESMMLHDMEYLQEIEVTCYAMEEWLISESRRRQELESIEPTTDILRYRKQLLMRNFYYQQFADLCDILAGNEHGFFGEKEVLLITDIGKRADRLYDYSQMLREYLVQIRELYQQQIDLQQNRTMQVLTVVTTIFLPLSLIAGWYGMNFEYMPELQSPYGYWVIVGAAILIVIGEVLYFRRKKYI
ncbi:MAG: hypothetical protein NC180_11725 [Muribaculaceae bacterium]|nr:hypothetical protein [Roseburia sp.]MCM1430049.1 hypothetical protein [Muribaculaceae bacterium]MCM1493878.1 hypothetical protein [Muribaculaceae bacterium]